MAFEKLEEEMENDALEITDDQLADISGLAKLLEENDRTIDLFEERLKKMKKDQQKLSEEILPEALQNLGCRSFELNNGDELSLKPFVYCSIPQAKKEQAFEKLREWEVDDIIKNDVSVRFGRGETEEAEKLKKLLNDNGFVFNQTMKVEPMTLKALFKERIATGKDVADDIFSIHAGQKACLKRGKK